MSIKPHRPELQRSHPLARGRGALRSLRALYPCCERGGVTVRNLAVPGQDATLTGGTRVPTRDGIGIGLNGSSDLIVGGTGPDLTGASAFSAWARFVLRASPANGAYSGIFSQWNDPTSNIAFQKFNIAAFNNAFTRPANSISLGVSLSAPSSPAVNVQYQAGDLGAVWTALGTYDGANLRIWLALPSGIVTASSSVGAWTVAGISQANTIAGRLDGFYSNMVFLGGAIWTGRALGFRDFLGLHRDPWSLVTAYIPQVEASPPPQSALARGAALLPMM